MTHLPVNNLGCLARAILWSFHVLVKNLSPEDGLRLWLTNSKSLLESPFASFFFLLALSTSLLSPPTCAFAIPQELDQRRERKKTGTLGFKSWRVSREACEASSTLNSWWGYSPLPPTSRTFIGSQDAE